jgi:hypothetical protein
MFASGFDQDFASEDFIDYPAEWEDYPPTWQEDASEREEAEYLQADESGLSPDPSGSYSTDDYPPDDYPADDFSLGALPKFLFVCTILACLVLAAGLSLVTIQVSSTGSQAVAESSLPQAQAMKGDQPELEAAQPSGVENTTCLVSERFPESIRRWCGLITQYASQHGLPPDLVAALIWQESGGNPVAYSRSGAVGLMQVMPSDGLAASFQCAGGPCFSSRPSTDRLKDPGFNVSYGTRMLAGLVGRTGNLREALKSYGPMDVGYYYADKVMGIYQRYGN